ncbi:kinase [Herbaspirillum seropedicae]|jgi:D-glycero-alpha-D-manno-heptose-7-phosphate kinase|uniref:Galactokinase/mevalonate kinase protein n=1 Tax=Herbaspirillum seropedicae (strain SmR1) TaxID=757424 RepID=D8IVS2_HERSS|nr:kinase [Herbaspirillum seropedicae]ADJ65880.1 galactokinase/mevalonate kinase protein [Herbaspirillum seropedicae SmR1]AKN67672.1 kinase [Herbaspirillum seropedicae]NQE29715.1 kinase [Herbaspirillum seropedicae]QDD66625.1 kinase [Herbaspirillum seropedicae]UMU23693.1 kinase [Herbaspirillum seropedicae]
MIITRTPFRMSFFGGGTDYPGWYAEHGGAVLATSIDKYCYITCRHLPPFFEHKHRIVHSLIENVQTVEEIKHPAVRGILGWTGCERGLEIHHDGDLPARSGLGSSSSFTVGMLHALAALEGRYASKQYLASTAIHIEQNVLAENVGSQDQVSAAYGGFNMIEFHRNGSFSVSPVVLRQERLNEFHSHLMLCFTGFSRIASEVAKSQIDNLKQRQAQLHRMREMVDEAMSILQSEHTSIDELGKLLHESWLCKRSLSDKVSTSEIDYLYQEAMQAGAIGGKIMGAGGGGFLMLFVKPEQQPAVRERLKHLIHVPFKFDDGGTRIVMYNPTGLN